MTTRIADNFADIAKRAEEIRAELQANIMGKPLEDPQPTEAPKDIDWGMYAPCGYNMGAADAARLSNEPGFVIEDADVIWSYMSGVPTGGTSTPTSGVCENLPPYTPTVLTNYRLKSLAHPAWPYAGTGHEWRKFVK